MSTPRVGSSITSTSGRFTIAAAMATFCWLPPESDRIGIETLGALIWKDSRAPCAIDFMRPRRRRPLRAAISRLSRDTMLSPTVRLANSVAWRSADTKLLSDRIDAGARAPADLEVAMPALEAGDRADELARTRPFDTHEGHDLARADIEVDAGELPALVGPVAKDEGRLRVLAEVDDELLLRRALRLADDQLGRDRLLRQVGWPPRPSCRRRRG